MFTGIGGFEYGIEQANMHKHEPKESRQADSESRREWSVDERGSVLPANQPTLHNEWECVGYSEIDKYAIQVYQTHYPNHKNYGDATKINPDDLPDFDLICGGFPCQSFSIAGKRMGFKDTRGTLFFDIARIIERKKPQLVFLENVAGLLNHDNGRTFATILASLDELGYNAEWEVLNSKHFGVPQNRERVFIIGHLRGTPCRQVFPIGQSNGVYYEKHKTGQLIEITRDRPDSQRIYNTDGVARTLKANGGGQGAKTGLYAIPVLTPNREEKRQNGRRFKENGDEMFTLTGQDIHGVAIMDLYNHKEHTDRSPTLTEPHHNTLRVREGTRIRKLTPTECARLQGFPDNWCSMLSDTQQYKCYGNAVTTNVIQAIVEKIRC